jgi:hypothetical protein
MYNKIYKLHVDFYTLIKTTIVHILTTTTNMKFRKKNRKTNISNNSNSLTSRNTK